MERLIDEAFFQRLAKLRFIAKGRRKGRLSGRHVSPRAGISLEFADYRQYAPGDDFRYVDWNIYGRLDRILVKTYVHETDLPIYLLVDCSASMSLGIPPKVHYAARLATAIAYLGLRGLDRVGLFPFSEHLGIVVPPRHGMKHLGRIFGALRDTEAGGRTSLDDAISEFLKQTHENGIVFVVSDFLTPGGYEEGFARLRHRGDEPIVVQVLAPEDLHPTATGTTRLVDAESARRLTITIGPRTLREYERRLQQHCSRLRSFLAERRIPYFLAPTRRPLEQLFHEDFRGGGILR